MRFGRFTTLGILNKTISNVLEKCFITIPQLVTCKYPVTTLTLLGLEGCGKRLH